MDNITVIRRVTGTFSVSICKRAAALALACTMGFTHALWTGLHGIPTLPVHPVLKVIDQGWATVPSAIAFLSCILMVCVPKPPKWLSVVLLVGLTGAITLDQNRFQVWLFHMVFILAFPQPLKDLQTRAVVLWVIGITYIMSGAHKLNVTFYNELFPWFVSAFGLSAPAAAGWSVPAFEICVGIALCIPRWCRAASIGAMLMHGLICWILVFHHWNWCVLPWNLLLCFYHLLNICLPNVTYPMRDIRVWSLTGVFALTTFLSGTGVIHSSLSFPLYSGGHQYSGVVVISDSCLSRMPSELRALRERFKSNGESFINLDRFYMETVGALPFQSKESYVRTSKFFLNYAQADNDVVLLVRRGQGTKIEDDLWAFTRKELARF